MWVSATVVWLLALHAAQGQETASVTGLVGEAAELPCQVDVASCGRVYFITWTKNGSAAGEWKRLYLYSDSVEKPLQELANPDRADFRLDDDGATLRIAPLRAGDEGTYKCDVTYVKGKCPSLSFATLTLIARPDPPTVVKDGREVVNGSTVGPLREGQMLELSCVVTGGQPDPVVLWRRADGEELPTDVSRDSESHNVTARVRVELTRADLGAQLECVVQHPTLSSPLSSMLTLDLHVRPLKLQVTEKEVHAVAGEPVLLTCVAEGARPAPVLTWTNGSVSLTGLFNSEPLPDGTFRTVNELEVVASRFDQGRSLTCLASHVVPGDPLEASVRLYVLYPPVVTVQPSEGVEVREGFPATMFCTYDANPSNVSDVRWLLEDGTELLPDPGTVDMAELGFPALALGNVSRSNAGFYGCEVTNKVGTAVSSNLVELSVLYPPQVEAAVSPEEATEREGAKVTLRCGAIAGNPLELQHVRWYKDGAPLGNESSRPEVEWLNVSRNFSGQFSCQGENRAGWGPVSAPVTLRVRYPPGEATLSHPDQPAVKGRPTSLQCQVVDPGEPPAHRYRWLHDGRPLDSDTATLHLPLVTLASRGNYTCSAVNAVGPGRQGSFHLHPRAPPRFVEKPTELTGEVTNATSASLTCRVECDPLCEVEWLRNGQPVDFDKDPYRVKSTRHPEDPTEGTFWSVVSTLFWRLDLWPGGQLDKSRDNAHYTCRSSQTDVGPAVTATTYFRVQYAPSNVTLSTTKVHVTEGQIPAEVHCSAEAWPAATFVWQFERQAMADSATLVFTYPLVRGQAGRYTCTAANRHGVASASVYIDVQYKPECFLSGVRTEDGFNVLTCEAHGNPYQVQFTWLRGNETLTARVVGNASVLSVPSTPEHDGMYRCIANNSVGESKPCSLKVVAAIEAAGWIPELSDENLVLVCGVAAAIVIGCICIAIATFLLVKRKRISDSPKVVLGKRENPEGRVQAPPPTAKPVLHVGPNKPAVTFKKEDDDESKKRRKEDTENGSRHPEPVYQNLPGNQGLGARMSKDGRRPKTPIPTARMRTQPVYENVRDENQNPAPKGPLTKRMEEVKERPKKLYINDLYSYMNREDDVDASPIMPRVGRPIRR